ncbi:hypothetical protein [Actinomadura napierensis]
MNAESLAPTWGSALAADARLGHVIRYIAWRSERPGRIFSAVASLDVR